MAFRRRRRNRGTWLPVDPTFFNGIFGQAAIPFFGSAIRTATVGTFAPCTAIPIVLDGTVQPATQEQEPTVTMRDIIEGQEYFIDRIVGKTWVDFVRDPDEDAILQVLECVAIAVLPVEDDGNTIALTDADFNPLNGNNSMGRYIWRRTWMLYNNGNTSRELDGPETVNSYGSVMDGPHVDAKTRARVRKNERLFWLQTGIALSSIGEPGTYTVNHGFDLRIHGALRRARNQSTFR